MNQVEEQLILRTEPLDEAIPIKKIRKRLTEEERKDSAERGRAKLDLKTQNQVWNFKRGYEVDHYLETISKYVESFNKISELKDETLKNELLNKLKNKILSIL